MNSVATLFLAVYSCIALQDVKTDQISPPSPGETSLVEASAKHPEQGGLMPLTAKEKKRIRDKKYRESHLQQIAKRQKEWTRKNPEKCKAAIARSKARNPEKFKSYKQKSYRKHKEKRLAYSANWAKRNPDKVRAKQQKFYYSNHARALEIAKTWRQKNREKYLASLRAYRKANPEKFLEYKSRRKRLVSGATVDSKSVQQFYKRVRSSKSIHCYYCKIQIAGKVFVDHIVAISCGGAHSVENLCASCKPCNQSKSDKSLNEWQPCGQQVLPL